jgi:hypothetical protein
MYEVIDDKYIYIFNIFCAFGWNKKKKLTAKMHGVEASK